jgi:acid stress-induced BolA-like protein IbaG/YrbA
MGMRSKREMETFNRLMESLKKGQTHSVLVSSLNPKLIVDGYKRRIAAINSNVELKTQVREHKTVDEWLQDLMNHASCPETKASVKDKYEALKTAFPELGTESIIRF